MVKSKNNTEGLTLVKLPGSEIEVLFPKGYEVLEKNALPELMEDDEDYNDACFHKTVSTSDNYILMETILPEMAMDPEDVTGLIDGIHDYVSDDQGLIEVKSGITSRGYNYIYSLIKNRDPENPQGNIYFLRLNLFNGDDVAEIKGNFTEIGTTGIRESFGMEFARRAGLVNLSEGNMSGWNYDPYDPDFRRGYLMNLSEKEGLDGFFPDHPLSQAREFLLAVLKDEFVTVKETPKKDDSKDTVTPEEKKAEETKLMKAVFSDKAKRPSYPVKIEK